jgi:predicted ATPase
MTTINFLNLPSEYQHLLSLAKENYNLDVIPLQELKGGRTGAFLYLVSVTTGDTHQVKHLVLKFDHVSERTKQTEVERHKLALSQAPPHFAKENLAELAYEVADHGAVALFYSIAGQSLQRYRTLASLEKQSMLEVLFSTTNNFLLKDWNAKSSFEQAVPPRTLLEKWLGYRLKPDGNISSLLQDTIHFDPLTAGFLIQGQVYPNPLSYGLDASRWKESRAIDVLTGFQHGDLNIGNILATFTGDSDELSGFFLIDFALYKSQMPLLYDQCYLELSYLIREIERAPLHKWISLVLSFADQDTPDPRQVPFELAGACTVVNAGRDSFERWVQSQHPSLSDDLWGQFWLAAVAVGLNFCNKEVLSTEERLAGLIYSASHLKRFLIQFGIPMPADVRLLYDAKNWQSVEPSTKAIRSASPPRNTLPIQPTPFIGRRSELKTVEHRLMLEDVHLVTLTGPGGTGKTRLALKAATDLFDCFQDGVFFVDLSQVKDPGQVFSTIARAIGLRESSDKPSVDVLEGELKVKAILLLLDNFEQVTPAAPRLAELIRGCPQLKFLVTSREALHVRGEQILPIPPMQLPQLDIKRLSVGQINQSESIQLFVECARAVKPDFDLTSDNALSVVELCLRLDGLPLAIELATARLTLFSPQDLLNRVGNRLKLLRGGARDLPERQQTLRNTLDWSYELLNHNEQRLFALFSIFSGASIQAVETVVRLLDDQGDTEVDVLDDLSSLIEKNLIRKIDLESGDSRVLMLETIREYARDHLDMDPGFANNVIHAHAVYYAEFTQRQWQLIGSDGREVILNRMEPEIKNIQASWAYWVAQGDLTNLRKITDSLWLFYDAKGWYGATVELTNDLLQVLSSTPSTPELVKEKIVLQTSLARALLAVKGYTPEVEKAYSRALELSQSSDEAAQVFPVLRGLYSFYTFRGEFEKGLDIGQKILDLAQKYSDNYMRITGYYVLGSTQAFIGNTQLGLDYLDKAISYINPEEKFAATYQVGSYSGVPSYTTSAMLLWGLGYPDRASQKMTEAENLARNINHPYSLTYALFHNCFLRFWMRQTDLSLEYAQAVLRIAAEHEFQIWTAVGTCLQGAGLAVSGQPVDGMAQIEQGMDMYRGLKSPPIFWPLLRGLQAKVCGLVGDFDRGLAFIEESIAIPSMGFGKVLQTENFQIKGNLLLARSPEQPSEAEFWFQHALQTAREQGAIMLELRAAVQIARIWQGTPQAEQGLNLVRDIYSKFTEGFTFIDLIEARELLEKKP